MLTVKHVAPTEHEALIEAVAVRWQPRMGDTPPTLFIEHPGGTLTNWTSGSFFVMNEKGATVSKYWLGKDCKPVHHERETA